MSYVDGKENVRLKDIAEFSGLDQSKLNELANIEISNAPKVGERVELTISALSIIFRKHIKEFKSSNIKLVLPERAVIENSFKVLNRENLEKRLSSEWKQICKNCSFEIQRVSIPATPKESVGKNWKLEVSEEVPRGSFNYRLDFENNKKVFWVSGIAKVYKKVPVARRALQMGIPILKDDIELKNKEITFLYDSSPSLNDLMGKKLKRSLGVGEIILQGHVFREKAVKRGQLVKIKVLGESFEISMLGKAEQDGYIGDRVSVRNLNTNKLISGRLTTSGEVVVK